MQRRELMLGMLAVGVSPSLAYGVMNTKPQQLFISAEGKSTAHYGLSWVKSVASPVPQKWRSGFRGHGIVRHPTKPTSVIMFARRPGRKAIEVDLATGDMVGEFNCATGRHMLGHGCFSLDAKVLYSAELDYQSGQGKIVLRDAENYQELGEFSSYGVGPHEIKMLPNSHVLAVANGGIKTHPDSGRKKLNLSTMESSIALIDTDTGRLLEQYKVEEPKASIRHIDVSRDGVVAFAMQVQRSATGHNSAVPLGGVLSQGKGVELFKGPEAIIHRMNDYAGSVAINNESRVAGFTSPRGNIAVFWHLDTKQLVGYHQLHDVCGLAVSEDEKNFVVSNSSGQLRFLDAMSLKEERTKRIDAAGMHWDNHLLAASI